MEPEESGVLQLELKYCERCGGLWLRVRGTQGPYCSSCAAAMSKPVTVHKSKRPPRLPVRDINGQYSNVYSLLMKGGLA
jgi:predicted amidophosphoribosyltransferase